MNDLNMAAAVAGQIEAGPSLIDRITNISDFIWGGTWDGNGMVLIGVVRRKAF